MPQAPRQGYRVDRGVDGGRDAHRPADVEVGGPEEGAGRGERATRAGGGLDDRPEKKVPDARGWCQEATGELSTSVDNLWITV